MSKPIAIIGAGENETLIRELLAKEGHHDVIIMTPEEAKECQLRPFKEIEDSVPIIIEPLLDNPFIIRKQFICKGKHQYRDVDGEWICQCGKTLK